MEAKLLHYVRVIGIYRKDEEVKSLRQMSYANWASHFWRKHLPAGNVLSFVDCRTLPDVKIACPSFTNVGTIKPEINVHEVVFGKDLMGNALKWMLQSGQKSIEVMLHLVQKCLKSADFALAPFEGKLSTGKSVPIA